jgi:hypothetical protein
VSNVDDVDLEHRWHSVDLIALMNCLKISSGALYSWISNASSENNRSNRAAGALDTGDVVVFG